MKCINIDIIFSAFVFYGDVMSLGMAGTVSVFITVLPSYTTCCPVTSDPLIPESMYLLITKYKSYVYSNHYVCGCKLLEFS